MRNNRRGLPSVQGPCNTSPFLNRLLSIACAALLAVVGASSRAATCTSLNNGNWNQASTWNCGHVPAGGDSVIVLLGDTVSITQNHVYNGLPLHIKIYGVWYFSGGGSKITLPCGSTVEIMPGGYLNPNSNSGGHSETVRICGTTYWYFDQGAQGGYQIWPPNPLPVEFLHMSAEVDHATVRLHWATATETNSSHFELYRSSDGVHRSPLARVPAQGESHVTTLYAYDDHPVGAGIWYYHLVEVDLDGAAFDLATIAVNAQGIGSDINCRPNPVTENHLMVTSEDQLLGARVHLTDVARRSQVQPHLIWEEDHLLMLDVSGLASGIYVAEMITLDHLGHRCVLVVP